MTTTSWFIVSLIVFGTLFLVYGFSRVFPSNTKISKKKTKKTSPSGAGGICPLCASLLDAGEQLKSALYKGKNDSTCHIFGCPHCFPYKEKNVTRICPVCKRKVFSEGYLIARVFSRKDKKNHVHIIGCTECRKPKKP